MWTQIANSDAVRRCSTLQNVSVSGRLVVTSSLEGLRLLLHITDLPDNYAI